MLNAIVQTSLVLLGYMFLAYLIAQFKRNNGLADVAWGLGFVLVSLFTLWRFEPSSTLAILLNSLIFIWGWRLFFHILRRNWGKSEDFRYQNFRKKWGKWYLLRGFTDVFLLQGFLLLIISLPIIYVNFYDPQLTILSYFGAGMWLVGFFFEVVGDYQLAQFVKTKKPGQIMQVGLWKYTRHPNYFGEVVMWWGIFVMTLTSLHAWYLIVSPILITYLILFVSGIPMLEKKYENNPAFLEYKKRTSAFWPRRRL